MLNMFIVLLLMMSGTSEATVDDIVNMASQLAVETEDDWEVNEEEAKEFTEKTVIGKVISKRPMNGKLFHSIFSRMWKNIGEWKVKVLETVEGLIYIRVSFDTKEDARAIMEKQPWLFNGGILLLEEWPLTDRWQDARLNRVICWEKLKGFSLKAFTLNNVRRLAQLAGDVMEIKWSNPQQAFMNGYVRVKIGFPLHKSAFVGRFVLAGGTKNWVQIKFERMPMLCFQCGCWGHEQSDCKEEPAMEDIGDGQKVLKYGYWLKDEHPTPNCIVASQQHVAEGTSKKEKRRSDDSWTEMEAAVTAQPEVGNSRGAVVVPQNQGQESLGVSGVVITEIGGKNFEERCVGTKNNGPATFVGPQECSKMIYGDKEAHGLNVQEAHGLNVKENPSNGREYTQGRQAGVEVGCGNFQNLSRKGGRDIPGEEEGEESLKKRKGGTGFVVGTDEVETGKKNKGKGILEHHLSPAITKGGFVVRSATTDENKSKNGGSHGQRKRISIKNRARCVNRQHVEMGSMSTNQTVGRETDYSVVGCSQEEHFVFGAATENGHEAHDMAIPNTEDDINIRVDSSSPGHILVEVAGKDFLPWTLTCFYGHPDAAQWKFSWELLRNIRAGVHGAWLCIGDFNEIVSLAEKVGGRTRCTAAMEDFKEVIDDCGLIDFCSVKTELTWCNEHQSNQIMERLDRGLCNEEWLRCFEGADIQVLDWWESDHRPLIVDLPVAVEHDRCGQTKRKTRFHFEEAWCDDDECKDIVLNGWQDGTFGGHSRGFKRKTLQNSFRMCLTKMMLN
ncbi:hypothetical protein F8388_004360 [Cannabis sativa]|uniref:CCHC-type domain-containing protein n=1 Tax=Cannabis sativa TaxID=3483 RepID=A0A7J6HAS1_CANSA|nr:hypothetical protein F8388_004360 [Cannabis sativa]